MQDGEYRFTVEEEDVGKRLDAWLAARAPEHSRGRWQALIKEGHVTIHGAATKPNHKLRLNDQVAAEVPPVIEVPLEPENLPLDVLYEDGDIICINKAAGMVVHPAPGHDRGTLVNALLYHCQDLQGVGGERRPGIVHRLDKDTSGVIVAAKHEQALNALMEQFKNRTTKKTYLCIVRGNPHPAEGTIETLIGRSAGDRKMMSARPPTGRPAITHYETQEAFKEAALLRIGLETGRTHQVRVHMAHKGNSILGDAQYGRKDPGVPRQMLHAYQLVIAHPVSKEPLTFTAPLPADMERVLDDLRDE